MDSSLKTAKRGGAKSDHQKGPNQVDEINCQYLMTFSWGASRSVHLMMARGSRWRISASHVVQAVPLCSSFRAMKSAKSSSHGLALSQKRSKAARSARDASEKNDCAARRNIVLLT